MTGPGIFKRFFKIIIYLVCILIVPFLLILCANKIPKDTQGSNQAPSARSLTKSIQLNSPLSIYLGSLCSDDDGDELIYMQIEDLPRHGIISLFGPEGDLYYRFDKTNAAAHRKFDGHILRLEYLPERDFIGNDSFTYRVVDAKDNKSNTAMITILVANSAPIAENKPPQLKDMAFTTAVKSPLHIDLRSLVIDPDGDFLSFTYGSEDRGSKSSVFHTFVKTAHGLEQGGSYFINYLPKETGREKIPYFVWENSTENKKSGMITIEVVKSKELTWADRHSQGGFIAYLKSLPLPKSFSVILMHSFIYLFIGIGALFAFQLVSLLPLNRRFLLFAGIGLFFLGVGSVAIQIIKMYYIKYTLIALVVLISSLQCLLPAKAKELRVFLLDFLKGDNLLLFLLFSLNALILYYHYESISLPAVSLDAPYYIPLYNFFKYHILGVSSPDHYYRVFMPFLAHLVPVKNTVLAFKIVNFIFMNLAVIMLFKVWKALYIRPYLVLLAFFWLFLHQYGIVRFYNFWPTSIDVPSYFFRALLLYLVLKKNYFWLIVFGPIASLQKEDFLVIILFLLGYKYAMYILMKDGRKENKRDAILILTSFILSFLAFQVPKLINPIHSSNLLVQIKYYILQTTLGSEPMHVFMEVILYFMAFGGMLILLLQNIRDSYRRTDLFNVLILLIFLSLLIGIRAPGFRNVFLAYPFIITLALLVINKLNPMLVAVSFILSLPLMRLWIDYPFVNAPMLDEASYDSFAFYGLYIVVVFYLLSVLSKSGLLERKRC